MKSLYEPSAAEEAKRRILSLNPTSQRFWGRMNVSQMLAHCSVIMETATGDRVIPRNMLGRLLGQFLKPHFTNDKPLSRDGPTAPEFIVGDQHDFAAEQSRLIALIDRFSSGGPAACTQHPHCFFGKLTPEEWGKGMYKHLDHHLRQFDV